MWDLKQVLYFGIVSVPVPVPHKFRLIRPSVTLIFLQLESKVTFARGEAKGSSVELCMDRWGVMGTTRGGLMG